MWHFIPDWLRVKFRVNSIFITLVVEVRSSFLLGVPILVLDITFDMSSGAIKLTAPPFSEKSHKQINKYCTAHKPYKLMCNTILLGMRRRSEQINSLKFCTFKFFFDYFMLGVGR